MLTLVDRNFKTDLLIENFHLEIQMGLVSVGWSGEPHGVSGQFLLVFCPSPGVYFSFVVWVCRPWFQWGSELKLAAQATASVAFLHVSNMLTVCFENRFCSWACCLYRIKVKWLQCAIYKSLVVCASRKLAVVECNSLLSLWNYLFKCCMSFSLTCIDYLLIEREV